MSKKLVSSLMDNDNLLQRLDVLKAHAELIIEEIQKIKKEISPTTAQTDNVSQKEIAFARFRAIMRKKYFGTR